MFNVEKDLLIITSILLLYKVSVKAYGAYKTSYVYEIMPPRPRVSETCCKLLQVCGTAVNLEASIMVFYLRLQR